MKILEVVLYVVLGIVGLLGLGLVVAILDDCLFGEARRKEAREKMFEDIISGRIAASSKPPTHRAGIKIIGLLVAYCALNFGAFGSESAEARQIDTIIVHHTAGADVSAKVIDLEHRARGWSGIGYHYLIRADGTVEPGRPINKVGAHAKGRNEGSIGIALTGQDHFTLAQSVALASLVEKLCAQYPVKSIERHHEKCPGPGLNVEKLRRYVHPRALASHFSDWNTASGKHIYPWTVGCASWFYPLGCRVLVTNTSTGKKVLCEVIDRGPNKKLVEQGRVVDLTPAAFARIGDLKEGLIPVKVERAS